MASDNKNRRLQELGGSDFKIVEGEPNIKGWDVKDETGKKFGEVNELIFDTESRKVRYIIVDLEGNVFDFDTKEVLVPIGIAQLDEKEDDVILPGVSADQIRALPEYHEDQLDASTETKVRNVFAGLGAAGLAATALPSDRDNSIKTDRNDVKDEDFYSHHHFNDEKFYGNRKPVSDENTVIPIINENIEIGKREVEKGGMRVRSRVVENEVKQDINLREEKVNVDRTPVDRPASEAEIREQEIEMRETKEVPVVNKEARVVEEISLNREVNEREETIRETVKNTDIDIEKLDSDDRLTNK